MSVIVIGCGVFGLSAALNLAQKGYKVTALDVYPVPSPIAAANDINKIIRTEYSDFEYTKLAVEALEEWRSNPLYQNQYVECGRFTLTPIDSANSNRTNFEQQGIENLKKLVGKSSVKEINCKEELVQLAPVFLDASLKSFKGKYNPEAGYGHASNSLKAVYQKCVSLGVIFKFGKEGKVVEISEEDESVITESGDIYFADKILLANGSSAGYVLDLENQVHSLGFFVTHIQLNEEEYEKYRNIPIFFSSELGYFFPPDPETHLLKIALTYAQATNKIPNPFITGDKVSLPRFKINNSQETMPVDGDYHARKILELVVPDLKSHELIDSKSCWIGDTFDSNFIIDRHPKFDKVFVAIGDSGHGFKFMPVIGKYIVERMEDKLSEEWDMKWKWKSYPTWPEKVLWRTKREHLEFRNIQFYRETKSKL